MLSVHRFTICEIGDFALTAAAIAKEVGIITNPLSAVKHLDDLPRDMPIEQVAKYNPDKEPGDELSSIVVSGPEMMTMTESQWAQLLTLSIHLPLRNVHLHISEPTVRRDCFCSYESPTEITNCSYFPGR